MQASQRSFGRLGLAASILGLLVGSVRGQTPGQVLPLTVENGRCECVLPTEQPGEKYFLMLGSLARNAGPYRITIRTETTQSPPAPPIDKPATEPAWTRRVRDVRARLEPIWKKDQSANDEPPGREPPPSRTFYLFTRERDFENAAGYV